MFADYLADANLTDAIEDLHSVVSVDTAIMHGTPCFTGTRVPAQTLLDYIEEGDTLDSFLKDFPKVTRDQAIQFFELANQL